MEQEKQIREMARDICENCRTLTKCDKDICTMAYKTTEHLIEKGWKKETQGEWIEHIEKCSWLEDDVEVYYNCSVCGTSHWSITPPYCPNCGAKMRGE